MADRPIPFKGPMVRAIIEGRKTQTRRVLSHANTAFNGRPWSNFVKAQTWDWNAAWVDPGPSPAGNAGPYLKLPWLSGDADPWEGTTHRVYPLVQPGDRLWVREAWRAPIAVDHLPPRDIWATTPVCYEADGSEQPRHGIEWGRYRHSMFMPRWASRITNIVESVRIERLQEITEEDAVAEGLLWSEPTDQDREWTREYALENGGSAEISGVWLAPGTRQGWGLTKEIRDQPEWGPNAVFAYRCLWNSINGPGSWDENPWVAAIRFRSILANIDQIDANGRPEVRA